MINDYGKNITPNDTSISALRRFFQALNEEEAKPKLSSVERIKIKDQLLSLLSAGDEQEKACHALIRRAQSGDVRAFETIREIIGEGSTGADGPEEEKEDDPLSASLKNLADAADRVSKWRSAASKK